MEPTTKPAPLPSKPDVDFYDAHGWWISPQLFSDEQMDAAAEAASRHHAEGRVPLKPGRLSMSDHIVFGDPDLGAIGMAPVLGAVAARLARTDEIRLFYSSLVYKPPHTDDRAATVGWHAERAYWQTSSSVKMLSAWIPLHDCDEEMGAIAMIDGSNRWPPSPAVDAMRTGKRWADDLATVEHELAELGHPIEKVPMRLRRGQVSFHNCLTFHGSDVNRSDRPRVALTVHLQDGDNRYREVRDTDGGLVAGAADGLVRRLESGEPDYADPRVCPVLWREEWAALAPG